MNDEMISGDEIISASSEGSGPPISGDVGEVKEKKKKKKKKAGSNRGVETLFRNIYRVHVEVSAMADNKANFLISVNSIILVLAAAHAKEVVTERLLVIPAAIVIFTCIGSMIFAVLVARPRVTGDKPSEKFAGNDPNLLFFGIFCQISKERYVESLSEMAKNSELVYPAMAADIYGMGLVLRRKFRHLQTAYGFLLYGMPGGIVLFLTMQTILRILAQN